MSKLKTIIKKIKETAPIDPEIRFVSDTSTQKWAHQGDVALVRIDKLPEGKKITELQLAPGTTKGSRHILADFEGIIIQHSNHPLYGPAFQAKERFTLTHPEHAHYSLPPGCYQVIYQQDNEMEEIRRVQD